MHSLDDRKFNGVSINSTDFNFSIKNSIKKEQNDNTQLKFHQFAVNKFFTQIKESRGLLICHSTGQGKTRLAVSIAVDIHKKDRSRKIIVLSAKSLADNFRKELLAYANDSIKKNNTAVELDNISDEKNTELEETTNVEKDTTDDTTDDTLDDTTDDTLDDTTDDGTESKEKIGGTEIGRASCRERVSSPV